MPVRQTPARTGNVRALIIPVLRKGITVTARSRPRTNPIGTALSWLQLSGKTVGYASVSILGTGITGRKDIGQWCMRRWCNGCLQTLGIEVTVAQSDLLRPYQEHNGRQCVYVANHLSELDVLVIGSILRGDYRWLAKESLFRIPFLGWHLSLSGHIPVHKEQRQAHRASSAHAPQKKADTPSLANRIRAAVKQGASLLFFPEGTRSETGQLGRFHLGAFFTAVQASLPIVPLVVQGTHELYDRHAKELSPTASRRCSLTVLPAIMPGVEGSETRRAAALRDATREAMAKMVTMEAMAQ